MTLKNLAAASAMMFLALSCSAQDKDNGNGTTTPSITSTKAFATAVSKNMSTRTAPVEVYINLNDKSLQSVSLDRKNGVVYTMTNQNDFLKVYGLDKEFREKVLKPHTGHNNDACVVGDNMWIIGTEDYADPQLWLYGLKTNKAERVDVSILDGAGTKSGYSAVCEYDASNLLLVGITGTGTDRPTDKLRVYKYNKGTKKLTQWFELSWHGVFVQGATYVNGMLYIATNISEEKIHDGASVWVVDVKNQKLLDEMVILFDGEAEGLDYNIEDGKTWLYMGLGSPAGKFAYVGRFKSLYQ